MLIVLPQEVDAIFTLQARLEEPKPPHIQTLLKQAQELKTRLENTPGLTQRDLAKELGIHPSRVTQILNLLNLAPEIQKFILSLPESAVRSRLNERWLRFMAMMPDHKHQLDEFRKLVVAHAMALPF